MLGDEVVVRLHAVARHAENIGAGFLELRVQITEILAFLGAARRVVLRIEVDDQRLALERAQADVLRAAGGQREIGNLVAGFQAHRGLAQVLIGSSMPSALRSSHRSMNDSRSACGCWLTGTCSTICTFAMSAPV